jgi:trehalose 6-phosphate phosphatase
VKEAILSFWDEVREVPVKEQQQLMSVRKEAILKLYFEWLRTTDLRKWFFGFDYDGNLAPFNANPLRAFPYDGIPERLDALSELGIRTAVITGGELARIPLLLSLKYPVHISANHGWTWQTREGVVGHKEVSAVQKDALDHVESWMYLAKRMGVGVWYERKRAGLVLHWRNLIEAEDHEAITAITSYMEAEWRAANPDSGVRYRDILRYDPINGGIEIRAKGEDKGKVFVKMMEGADAGAYFGDDMTDEDVFRAIRYSDELSGKALGVLVRKEWKLPMKPISEAAVQLLPPEELLKFLDRLYGVGLGIMPRTVSLPPVRRLAGP